MSCVFDSVFKSNGETTNAQQSQTIRKLLKIKSLALSKHPLASWSPYKLIHPINSKLPKSSFLMGLNYVTESTTTKKIRFKEKKLFYYPLLNHYKDTSEAKIEGREPSKPGAFDNIALFKKRVPPN